MRNKIAFRLTAYFFAALLVFSLIIGGVFVALFKKHTIEMHKTELEKRAGAIADTLSAFVNGMNAEGRSPGAGAAGGGQGGYGVYLRFIDDIAMADVWIVNQKLELLTSGKMAGTQPSYADLPDNAEAVVTEVFRGNTTFSEGFSELLKVPTLTAGTPIMAGGEVVGALLLHSPVEGIDGAAAKGISILAFSMFVALLLSVFLSVSLAMAFTKPLNRIKISAVLLAKGDYTAKTGVRQNDEIGDLADAVDLLSVRLDRARRESDRLDRLRRDFVANVSHELRTPVTVIRGSLEALCEGVVSDPAQVEGYHRQMLGEALHLQRLVNDLLDLSRLQNADFQIEMQRLNLCDVLADAVRSAEHAARTKNIEIRLVQDVQAFPFTGDYGRLRQMFVIVLDNAVKFSPKDSVVTVSLEGGVVSVRDRGVGISPEDLPYIFDRFYKTASHENKNGSGLGLAIVRQIAERHGIGVSAVSTLHEGAKFVFTFYSN